MALKSIGLTALLALSLAGCSALNGTGAGALVSLLRGKGGTVSTADIPRSELEKAGMPLMLLSSEGFGFEGFVAPRDSRGGIVNWGTSDGLLVTLRDGVLIETRGFGGDLMSSAMPGAGQISGGGSYRRAYFSVGPDDQILRTDLTCSAQTVGTETLSVYGLAYQTRHVIEACHGGDSAVSNEYWFQGSTIRKSREWVSPSLGYVELTRVID